MLFIGCKLRVLRAATFKIKRGIKGPKAFKDKTGKHLLPEV